MIAKLFLIILGALGVAATHIQSPANLPPPTLNNTGPVSEKIATSPSVENRKISTSAAVRDVKIKPNDFSKIKSPGSASKPVGVAMKTSTKQKTKKTTAETTAPRTSTVIVVPPTATTTAPATSPTPPLDVDAVNKIARAALVNIICTSKSAGYLYPLSGSGVIIDPRGVILTNAHIAQYFLLRNYLVPDFLDCRVRTGSPATSAYYASLLYISSSWVKANYKDITENNPLGTGENDFGLILIGSSTNPSITDQQIFPSAPFDDEQNNLTAGESVVLASYPAGFLEGIGIERNLFAVSSVAKIEKLYTFTGGTLDLLGLGGSVVAQKGSSGGGVFDGRGNLIGLIATMDGSGPTSERNLEAITIAHINRVLAKETGVNLQNLLARDLTSAALEFSSTTAPKLTELLENQLNKRNSD